MYFKAEKNETQQQKNPQKHKGNANTNQKTQKEISSKSKITSQYLNKKGNRKQIKKTPKQK